MVSADAILMLNLHHAIGDRFSFGRDFRSRIVAMTSGVHLPCMHDAFHFTLHWIDPSINRLELLDMKCQMGDSIDDGAKKMGSNS